MAAPSAGNQQPWEFIVVHNCSNLEEITKIHEYSQMLKQAPAAIVVCADPSRNKYPFDFWMQDCAAATQNILLAAVSAGLGACWLGIYPQPERVEGLRRIFAVPEHIVPFAVIALGYPAKPPRVIDRFDMQRVHNEKW
jgi:nitroreductase